MEKWESVSEVHNYAVDAVGKQIKELVRTDTVKKYYENPKNKGWIGNSIESDWFKIPNNSRHEADFKEIGLELKVTPIKKTKNGWSAKERLVLNIFDYNEEYKRKFSNASFIEKAQLMELMYYHFIDKIPSPDLRIVGATLFNLKKIPEEDMLIIQQDWNKIVGMIKSGKAHELSDSLTQYLGATTKGGKSERNMTNQPFSEIKAHRRSFTLKGSYMSVIAKKVMINIESFGVAEGETLFFDKTSDYLISEKIIKDVEELRHNSFEDILIGRFNRFKGMKKSELSEQFGVKILNKNDKASTRLLASKMLGVSSDIESTEEFEKSGIVLKTIGVNSSESNKQIGTRKTKEAFKIQNYFDYLSIIDISWEDSPLYEYLSETKFLLVVFEIKGDDSIFKGVKFWSIPYSDLAGPVKEVWERTKQIVYEGIRLTYVLGGKPTGTGRNYRIKNNFPKSSNKMILHVRPDAKVASYNKSRNSLPVPKKNIWINRPEHMEEQLSDNFMGKQAFWLNPDYMYQQISDMFL